MNIYITLTRKELSHLFNNPLGYLFCSLFPAILAWFLFWQSSGTNIFVNGTSDLRLFFKLAPFFLAVFVPLLAMRAWSEEKRQNTMEWLLSMPIPRSTLVWAKFTAPMLAITATLAATLPFAWTLFRLGSLDWGPTMTGYLGLFLFSAVALSFSLWISSLTSHQILSFLFSFLIFSFFAFFENSPLNLNYQLQQMAQGLLEFKDLIYFFSLCAFFLFLNIHFLEQSRISGLLGKLQIKTSLRILIVAGIVIALNAVSAYIPFQFDLTKGKIYTLSQSSRQVLDTLDEEVHLKLFFSSELPPQFQPVLSYIERTARQFEARSHGKFKVFLLNPDVDESIRREALGYGVQETEANVTQKSRVEMVKIWFGMALTQSERRIVFPTMQDIPNLEYDLTSALLKLNKTNRKTVLFAGPKPPSPFGHDPEKDLGPLYRETAKQFDVSHAAIYPDKTESFAQADALLVWGIREFTQAQLKELDQFILTGKPVVMFTTGVRVQEVELIARDLPEDSADEFFEHLGFKVGRNLVADNSCQRIRSSGTNRLLSEYPLFPLLTPLLECFPSSFQPLVSMQSLTLPWVSTLTPTSSGHTETILQTSKQAWLQERIYTLNPQKIPGPTSFERYPLGLLIHGPVNSFFPDGAVKQADQIKLAVIGTHHLLGQYQNPSSIAFLSNTLNYWCSDIDLSDIHRRENAFVPLPSNISFRTRRNYQLINLLFGPLCFMIVGIGTYFRRRSVRRTFQKG